MCLDGSAACEPKDVPANGKDWIVVQERPLGCWTDFIRQDGAEVHIINLVKKIFNIEMLNEAIAVEQTENTLDPINIYIHDFTVIKVW